MISTLKREQYIEQLSTEEYDIAIIGGGITGAGIALDAASRGLKVALIEKQDFSAGTSSRSTKLIHGGLRYLKQFEISLVGEVAHERKIVLQNAPHLVFPEKMLLPILKNGSFGKISAYLGLTVYDYLARVDKSEKKKMLSQSDILNYEPLLNKEKITGGAVYYEYRTEDSRLTIEVLKTATEFGAVCLNYAQCISFLKNKERIRAIEIKDCVSGKDFIIRAKSFINATGPWSDLLRKQDNNLIQNSIRHTKGVHLVVPYDRLPLNQSAYFDTPDGRMIFTIPHGKHTYLGTTDTNYDKPLESPEISTEDVKYLLDCINQMFPTVKLGPSDVVSGWAGIRPLIQQTGKTPSDISRKDEISISPSGLITIAGGKLTGYRKMAEKILDLVLSKLSKENGKLWPKCQTKNLKLTGGEFENQEAVKKLIYHLMLHSEDWKLSNETITYLVHTYGTNSQLILEKKKEIAKTFQENDTLLELLLAELWYGVNYEGVNNLSDFFTRRTMRTFFDRETVLKYMVRIQAELNKLTRRPESVLGNSLENFRQEFEKAGLKEI